MTVQQCCGTLKHTVPWCHSEYGDNQVTAGQSLPEFIMTCETASRSTDLIVDAPAKSFAHIMT